ncbi:MAG: hypothetical protein GPJ51_13285 [Candidatus Heimdallarchaeota archaeon]|nr:hypothetical protein [Candidatus Heimdallarchaeota archaeon]
MAKVTFKITTGIDVNFSILSDLDVAVTRIHFNRQHISTLIAGLISFIISVVLINVSSVVYNDEYMWLVIVGSIFFILGIGGLWWSKIYNDTRRKCDRELKRRVQNKHPQTLAPDQAFISAGKTPQEKQLTDSCQECGTRFITLNEYLETTTHLKMKALQDSDVFAGKTQIPLVEFVNTTNNMKPTKEMEKAMEQTNQLAKQVGLECKSCKIYVCANCAGIASKGNLEMRTPLCQICGNQMDYFS